MAIIIQAQSISMTPDLRTHMMQRFTFALRRFEDRISKIEIFVKDLSKGKAGLSKCVTVKIVLASYEPVVVEAVGHDLFVAVSLAARRCKRAIKRRLKEPLSGRRNSLSQLALGNGGEPVTGTA